MHKRYVNWFKAVMMTVPLSLPHIRWRTSVILFSRLSILRHIGLSPRYLGWMHTSSSLSMSEKRLTSLSSGPRKSWMNCCMMKKEDCIHAVS